MKPEDKIPSPFEAPEDYFAKFEDRLEARMSPAKGKPVMRVQKNTDALPIKHGSRRPILEWVAVAATVAILAATGIVFYMNKNTQTVETIAEKTEKNIPQVKVETQAPVVSKSHAQIEDEVVQGILDEAKTTTVSTQKTYTKRELKTARELEQEGLIVLETEDGLFDQFEL